MQIWVLSMKKQTPYFYARETLFYAALIILAVVMLLPFYWMIMTSLKPNEDIFRDPIEWLPRRITFEHYISAFTLVPFGRYFFNSTIMAVMGVISNLILGSMAGYALTSVR